MKAIEILSKKRGKHVVFVDDEDYDRVMQYRWTIATKNNIVFYVHRKINERTTSMHRFILGDTKGLEIDHRDGNGLNNCKSNLRLATRSENMQNSRVPKNNRYGVKGVCFLPNRYGKKWKAAICANNRAITLGHFHTKEEAAKAYNEAAKKYHGEFARLNVIDTAE